MQPESLNLKRLHAITHNKRDYREKTTMNTTDINYREVSIKQANTIAEISYHNVQLQVMVETLEKKLADMAPADVEDPQN